jgi:hypothetical protein
MTEVRTGLEEASGADDDYLVEVRLGELESLVRLAADHGENIEDAQELFARYGRSAPDLAMTGPIDLPDILSG